MLYGAVLVVHIEMCGQLVQADTGDAGEQLGDLRDAAVEPLDVGIDLDAVARRQHHGLVDVRALLQVMQQLAHVVTHDGNALEQRNRRAAVREADGEQAHAIEPTSAATPSAGSAARSSGAAGAASSGSTAVAFRCSWNARIWSSIERSTFRTSTWSGTARTVGAKLRMLVTPAATSRSATPWAAEAGVAITPIETTSSVTTSSRSSKWRTSRPTMCSPTRARSAS